jgi:penicillin-binding protein 2
MKNIDDLRQIQGRTRILAMLLLGAFSIILLSFWFIQVVRGAQYRQAAENNQFQTNRIFAPRGKMLDRSGETILVNNRSSFSISVIPEKSEDIIADLQFLQDYFQMADEDVESILERIRRRPSFMPALVREDIAFETMAYFNSRSHKYPWLLIQDAQKRNYPYKSLASHVFGNVGEITERQMKTEKFLNVPQGSMVGQSGLEIFYEELLRGKNGSYTEVRDSRGRVVRQASRQQPEAGNDLLLTLNFELQLVAEDLFRDKAGTLVALDVKTGAILAMVSSPTFDANLYNRQFKVLRDDETSPLLSRSISSAFSPGSVWKGLMAVAGLAEGLITPNTVEFCGGSIIIGNRTFDCNGVHERVNLQKALTRSCNIYFYKLGNKLKIDKIRKWSDRFGFGHQTGIDLPSEKAGSVPSPELMERLHKRPWYPADTVSLSIGQGDLLVTPLQLAVYIAAIANGGNIVRPHLVHGMRGKDGIIKHIDTPPTASTGISDELLQHVREGFWGVVNDQGTATRARIRDISVAGKTGSAQVVSKRFWRDDMPEEMRHHVWFVCFAPYEKPEIAIAVFVEHGQNSSRVAVPIAADFLRAYTRVRDQIVGDN